MKKEFNVEKAIDIINDICNENKRKLKFDFYLPDHNLCIEFDGQQHFMDVQFSGNKSDLGYIQKNDKIKNEYCQNNNIRLIRISFLDKDKIDEIINNYLK